MSDYEIMSGMSSDPFRNLDLRLDELDPAQMVALEKVVLALDESKIPAEDWPRMVAFGIAAWAYPAVRETLAEPISTVPTMPTMPTVPLREEQERAQAEQDALAAESEAEQAARAEAEAQFYADQDRGRE